MAFNFGLLQNLIVILANLVGILLNVIIIVIVKRTRPMQSTTNILLCNIALADILTILLELQSVADGDISVSARKILCRIISHEVYWAVLALTFSLIAFERYMALVKPMANVRIKRENIWYAITALWLCAAMFFVLPIAIFRDVRYDKHEERYKCVYTFSETSRKAYFSVIVSFYAANVVVTSLSYLSIVKGMYCDNTICSETVQSKAEADEKKKITAFLLLLTSLFMLAYIPLGVLKFLDIFYLYIDSGVVVLRILAFSFPVVNPLVYILLNSNYKAGLKKLLNDLKSRVLQVTVGALASFSQRLSSFNQSLST